MKLQFHCKGFVKPRIATLFCRSHTKETILYDAELPSQSLRKPISTWTFKNQQSSLFSINSFDGSFLYQGLQEINFEFAIKPFIIQQRPIPIHFRIIVSVFFTEKPIFFESLISGFYSEISYIFCSTRSILLFL